MTRFAVLVFVLLGCLGLRNDQCEGDGLPGRIGNDPRGEKCCKVDPDTSPTLAHLNTCPDWPVNIIRVTNSATNEECTAENVPHECCAGLHPNPGNTCGAASNQGIFEGADLKEALNACQTARGCVIQLPCAPIDDVSVDITPTANEPRDDRHTVDYFVPSQPGLTAGGFPNGLVIQGCGSSSVLRAQIPPRYKFIGWGTTGSGVLFFDMRPGVVPHGDVAGGLLDVGTIHLRRLALRDFVIDGRKQYQPAPDHSDPLKAWACIYNLPFDQDGTGTNDPGPGCTATELAGSTDAAIGIAAGISSGPFFAPDYLEVKGLDVRDFLAHSLVLYGGYQTVVTGNDVHGIGCFRNFSNAEVCTEPNPPYTKIKVNDGSGSFLDCCTKQYQVGDPIGTTGCDIEWNNGRVVDHTQDELGGCGSLSGQPDDYEWKWTRDRQALALRAPSQITHANGLSIVGNTHRVVIADNRTANTNRHYGLSCFGRAENSQGTYHPYSASALCRIDSNLVDNSVLMLGTHGVHAWMSKNTCVSSSLYGGFDGPNGMHYNSTACLQANGWVRRWWATDNVIQTEGLAIRPFTYSTHPDIKRGIRIENNVITDSGVFFQEIDESATGAVGGDPAFVDFPAPNFHGIATNWPNPPSQCTTAPNYPDSGSGPCCIESTSQETPRGNRIDAEFVGNHIFSNFANRATLDVGSFENPYCFSAVPTVWFGSNADCIGRIAKPGGGTTGVPWECCGDQPGTGTCTNELEAPAYDPIEEGIGRVQAVDVRSKGMILWDQAGAATTRWRWWPGSTGSCSGWTVEAGVTVANEAGSPPATLGSCVP